MASRRAGGVVAGICLRSARTNHVARPDHAQADQALLCGIAGKWPADNPFKKPQLQILVTEIRENKEDAGMKGGSYAKQADSSRRNEKSTSTVP